MTFRIAHEYDGSHRYTMATGALLGRSTAGEGAVEEIPFTGAGSLFVLKAGDTMTGPLNMGDTGALAGVRWKRYTDGATYWQFGLNSTGAAPGLELYNYGTSAPVFTIQNNAAASLGGFAPAWAYTGGSLELGRAGSGIAAYTTGSLSIIQNAYTNVSGSNWVYANNGYASLLNVEPATGQTVFYTAPTGTAGNNITFVAKLTLFGAGSGAGLDGTVYAADGFHAGSYSSTKYPIFGYKRSSSIPAAYFRQDNASGNMAEFSAGGGASQITIPYAGGILFPASQVANSNANALDDYEEGTWTPSTPTTNLTIGTAHTATYVKIGKLVYANFYAPITNSGAATNAIRIDGLPFTSDGNYGMGVPHYNADGSTSGANYYCYTQSGGSYAMTAFVGNSIINGTVGYMWTFVYRANA